MAVEQQEGYELFLKSERVFLARAARADHEIHALYLEAKKGNMDANRQLAAIMLDDDKRREIADTACALLFWLQRNT